MRHRPIVVARPYEMARGATKGLSMAVRTMVAYR